MKKVVHTICIFLSLAFAFVAVTFCWFSRGELLYFRDDFGSAKASYFGGGDGSREKPYEISSETHFYNFAWLQYLGYFNHAEANNGRYQSYFRLADNIDMIKLNSALPPIGTSKYPFIGNFDGCGYTVNNVTISNKLNGSDGEALKNYLSVRPTVADNFAADKTVLPVWGDTTKDVNIVGLFGITGDYGSTATAGGVVQEAYGIYSESNTAGKIRDTLKNPAASIEDKDANDQEKAYYGAMSVANFYADNLHVRSASDSTLVGLAAGYANAAIGSVGVYRCDITVKAGATGLSDSAPLSNYSLLGDYNSAAVSWKELTSEAGNQIGQGGTIDLRQLSRRLNYIYTKVYSEQTKPTVGNGYTVTDGNRFNGVNASVTFQTTSPPSQEFKYDGMSTGKSFYYYTNLNSGFYLPLKVNEVEMGLKKEAVDSTTNKKIYVEDTTNYTSYQVNGKEIAGGWNINEYYATHDSESVASDNTGYIVGGERVFVRIQPFVSSSSLQRSFGKAPKDTSLSWNEKTQILTKTGSGNFQVISDSKNSTTTLTIHPTLSDSSVGASDVIKSSALARYDDIRDDFDNLIGAKDYIYGMRFNYMGGSGTGPVGGARIKIDGKEYCTNAINFAVEKEHICTMLLGTYISSSDSHYVPELYKITRNQDGTIASVQRLNSVVKTSGGYKGNYNGGTSSSGTTVYNREWYNKLPPSCLYYIEIPIEANEKFENGDWKTFYAIGGSEIGSGYSTYSAYMMYLDIGTNGGNNTGEQDTATYDISTLDFVSKDVTGYAGTIASGVTEAQKTTYKDVSFALSANGSGGADGSDAYVKFERENKYSDGSEVASGDKDVATKVLFYYWNMTVAPTPSDGSLSSGPEKKENAA